MEMESYFTKKYATAESNKTLSTVLINVQCLHAWPKHFLPCSNLVQLLLKYTHMSMLVLMITCRTFLIINTVKDD